MGGTQVKGKTFAEELDMWLRKQGVNKTDKMTWCACAFAQHLDILFEDERLSMWGKGMVTPQLPHKE